jgi:hypothetical protein
MKDAQAKFFSKSLLKVGALACLWYIFVPKGFSEFFIALGVSPRNTLTGMIGAIIVPIVPTYFLSRWLFVKKGKNFMVTWFTGTIVILSIATIGLLNGRYHWW